MEVSGERAVAIVPSSDLDLDDPDFFTRQEATGKPEEVAADPGYPHNFDLELSPPSSPPTERGQTLNVKVTMPFSSSPVLYPLSSSPPPLLKKRKLFQTLPVEPPPKRTKVVGGFVEDIDDIVDEFESCPAPLASFAQSQGTRIANTETRERSPSLPPAPRLLLGSLSGKSVNLETSSGQRLSIPLRVKAKTESYEQIIAQRSITAANRAKRAFFGIEIHKLVDEARIQRELDQAQAEVDKRKAEEQQRDQPVSHGSDGDYKSIKYQMWTEKYRAKKFTELVGDERTHRSVLRWLKAWDDIVFPGLKKLKPRKIYEDAEERQHRKVLLLTGPPGLGKTTLAHVCAKQAGYESLEINASDDRSRDVVKGKIKDVLGTETVRGVKDQGKARKAGRPLCIIVDEVDGVTTGSGSSGEGGFMKALIDLVQLDQRNEYPSTSMNTNRKKKGDAFRMLRPLILICNDVYAPSLRPLRNSSIAEIVHVRRPALDKVMTRMNHVFAAEDILCDKDAVRRLCEASWGLGTRKQNSLGGRGAGEGDIRGVLVQAEWIAHKLRSSQEETKRLTRRWIETHLSNGQSGSGQKGLGRGGAREVVDRIFTEGVGMPNLPTKLSTEDQRLLSESTTRSVGVADMRKRVAITALREMVDMCGEHDRLMTDCFTSYPLQVFQDDTQLTKPNDGYDWLHFHDNLSTRIFGGQEWELNPYLSTSACGFHHLFASTDKGEKNWHEEKKDEEEAEVHPFSGVKADFAAYEAEKQNRTVLTELQASLSAPLLRLFSSVDAMATELIPNVGKMLAPDVKPIVIGGSGSSASVASVRKDSEKACVQNAVRVMSALDVRFDKIKVEVEGGGAHARGGFIYRMEP